MNYEYNNNNKKLLSLKVFFFSLFDLKMIGIFKLANKNYY
jgi:hypothetical protein